MNGFVKTQHIKSVSKYTDQIQIKRHLGSFLPILGLPGIFFEFGVKFKNSIGTAYLCKQTILVLEQQQYLDSAQFGGLFSHFSALLGSF